MLQDINMNKGMNGRPLDFELSRDDKVKYTNHAQKAITGIQESTPLSKLFFDQINIDALQEAIRYSVYKKSCNNAIIDKQDQDQLLIVMRSIYLQYSINLKIEIIEQIKILNSRVLDYCVKEIMSQMTMYTTYLKDRETIPVGFNPISTSIAGTKNFS